MALADQQISATGQILRPIAKILVNRQELRPLEVEVEETGDYACDTFRVVIDPNDLPPQLDLRYWSDCSNVDIEILGGYLSDQGVPQLSSWLSGRVDEPAIDLIGRTLTLPGRDMSGLLHDTKTSEPFTDQTSSQIAATIAARHGLLTQITPTATKAGKLYTQFHCRLARERTEWDLLAFLAEVEGFDLFVKGRTLYFGPPVAATTDPYVLRYQDGGEGNRRANFYELRMRKALTLAGDVIVIVRSWNQAQQKTFTATLKSAHAHKGPDPARSAQTYTFAVPNLDQSQCQAYAQARMAEIVRHERKIECEMDGDNLLSAHGALRLVGTGLSYDQLYYPVTLSRSISNRGYQMSFHAKNHSPRDVVAM